MGIQVNQQFNNAALSYDEDFTLSEIGIKQRNRVFHWLNKSKILKNCKSVFEVNCGTGYDAEWFFNQGLEVTATDASLEMINVAKAKRNSGITFYNRIFEDISIDENVKNSDLVFSNFGGLNCLDEDDLRTFFKDLALKQKTGDYLAIVIMPEHCLIEDVYFLLKGQFSKVFRRSGKGYLDVDVNGENVKTFYHSPSTVKQLMFNYYKIEFVKPVAHFLPPSYLEPFFQRYKWMLNLLYLLERIFGGLSYLAKSADHYIIISKRK